MIYSYTKVMLFSEKKKKVKIFAKKFGHVKKSPYLCSRF